MKVRILLLFVFISFASLLVPRNIFAKVIYQKQGQVDINSEELINDDLFIGSDSVNVDGTINGDVFIGANSVYVNGTINGNLHIGAGTVILKCNVKGNVYTGTGSLTVTSSKIEGSLIVGAGSVSIDKETTIGKSLIAGTGTLNNQANIGRNLMSGAGSVNLNSQIGGEARIASSDITIGPDTKIISDLTYTVSKDGKEINLSPQASVSGNVKKVETRFADKTESENRVKRGFKTLGLFLDLSSFIGAVLIGLIFVKLFPKHAVTISEAVTEDFWKNLGVGLLILLLIFPVILFLVITVIGIPLAFIVLMLFLLAFYFSKIFVGLATGRLLAARMDWNSTIYVNVILGLFIFYVLKIIPVIGFITSLTVLCSGLGAIYTFYRKSTAVK